MRLKSFLKPLVFFGLIIIQFAIGQTSLELEKYKKAFPGEKLMVKNDSKIIEITLKKGKLKVREINSEEILALDKSAALGMSEGSIEFSSFEKISKIVAYSLKPNKTSSLKVAANNFTTRDLEAEGSIFHDDAKVTNFVYPDLQEGSLRHLSYISDISESSFPFGYSFFNGVPSTNAEFVIRCAPGITIRYNEFYLEKSKVQFEKKIEKGWTIYRWYSIDNLKIKSEEFAPSPRYYAPHVLANIASYVYKGKTYTVGNDLKDLHTSYEKHIDDVLSETPSPELKEQVLKITEGKTTDYEKIKAIYYWVQENIKYIAFEAGETGFIPRQPNAVFEKRYGDCKDMACTIRNMAKIVNVPCYLVWIGSRDIPYRYTEVPNSFCDNHMIAMYMHEGNPIFLDATNSFLDIRYPSGFTQGKEAFIHMAQGEYKVYEVPVPSEDLTRIIDTSYFKIVGKNIEGNAITYCSGYYHFMLCEVAKSVQPKELEQFVTAVNSKGNNSFVTANSQLIDMKDREKVGSMKYDFKVNNYCVISDNETYLNMVLHKDLNKTGELKEDRIAPFEMDNKFYDTYINICEIPAGYSVKSVPKDYSMDNEFVSFSVRYKLEKTRIVCTVDFKVKFLYLEKENFAAWNDFVKMKKLATNESVVLIKQ